MASANYGLFQLLPYEIRREILMYAFGNRTVHMDIRYDHPVMPLDKRILDPDLKSYHVLLPPQRQQRRLLEKRKPKKWQWQSSICHRKGHSGGPMFDIPFYDQCHDGENVWCGFWRDERETSCFIGIMGWLVSCRRAYMEGIDVLYSTNTIHMANTTMIRNLPRLLPAQRLASIRSVEMLWNLHLFRADKLGDAPDSGTSAFHALLDMIPMLFPNLRKLYISLQGELRSVGTLDERYGTVEATILIPLDAMVRSLSANVQTCDIAVPYTVYVPIKHRATGHPGLGNRRLRNKVWERVWRELPHVALEGAGCTTHLAGFWIYRGFQDMCVDPAVGYSDLSEEGDYEIIWE
ncbi:hypothetical protein PRK78_005607 [Emydomyces testavorans]|uniref:DUF7730 domain-containing protein n=1 Tax=Emydomyces testavorans TaxID=2070801 RepID=A0AAF0DK26_9EURO|nr:hypothetical protein PRK78_005607 [Emydomyces testavorans]